MSTEPSHPGTFNAASAAGQQPAGPGEPLGAESEDDAVIGRAIRLSLLAVLVLAVGGGAAWYWAHRAPPPAPVNMTAISPPTVPQRPGARIPDARFTDITAAAGIDFVHVSGAKGEKLLPETMGGGVAFLDFDADGRQDLLFVNGGRQLGGPSAAPTGPAVPPVRLYRNTGNGRFADATAGSGLEAAAALYGMGVAVGDYDGDGRTDVLVTGVGGARLFHNEGTGKFADVTAAAGVGGDATDWSTSAAFADYDNDGRLDLFVCNYVRWSREIDHEVGYKLVGVGRAYGPPTNFQGAYSRLYHNEGGGRFRDASASAGVQVKNPATGVPAGKSLGVAPVDLDADGFIDFVVANDTVQNFAFRNRGDGTFHEMAVEAGVAFDGYGNARGGMGIDAARFRNDDALGIGIGNFANEMTALYVSQGRQLLFSDEAIPEQVGPPSRLPLKFGLFFFDYDLDGWQDLLTANGHLEEEIGKVQQSQTYAQPAQLFWNTGPARAGFVLVPPAKVGPDLHKPIVGRGSAYADIDDDGDLDVVLTQTGGPPLLLRNDQKLGNRWLRFKLAGTRSNREGIGAWVKVRVGGQTLWGHAMPARSYLSQSEAIVTFGLGTATAPESVEVVWPGGRLQKVSAVRIGQTNVVTEAQ